MSSLPFTQIDHYQLIRTIGKGGMGEVYLARDTHLERQVALKIFPKVALNNQDAKQRFVREAKAIASINHPNVVTIHDFGEVEGVPYLVLEYLEGESLRKRLGKGPLSIPMALKILDEVCPGLATAHQAGIVHRDIKPGNIFLCNNRPAKLLDFGLAKLESGQTQTGDQQALGTLGYMSPEQITGDHPVSPASDVFSLAVMFYNMVSGQLPFEGQSLMSMVYAVTQKAPKPLSDHLSWVPHGLEEVLQRALEKDPEQRTANVYQFLQEIHQACGTEDEEPTQTFSRSSTLPKAHPFNQQKNLRPWFLSPVIKIPLVLVVMLFAAWFFWKENSAQNSPPSQKKPYAASTQNQVTKIAILPFSVSGSPDHEYLREGLVNLLATKLDVPGELTTVDSRALLSLVAQNPNWVGSYEQGKRLTEDLDADYFLAGSLVFSDTNVSIEAKLFDKDQPTSKSAKIARGTTSQLFDLLDQIAAKTIAGLLDGAQLKKIAVTTTNSFPALKAYLLGEQYFRLGRYEQAAEAFKQAIEKDSEFALAYYRLSVVADWLTLPDLAKKTSSQAVARSERLSNRHQQLLQALLAWRKGEAKQAEELYRVILGTYTSDVEAWFQLGEVLFHYGPISGGSVSRARHAFEQVLEVEPNHVPALWHLARIDAVEGKLEVLSQRTQTIIDLQPKGLRLAEILTLKAYAANDKVMRAQALEELRLGNDSAVALAVWNVGCFTNNLEGAIELTELLSQNVRSTESQALGKAMQAFMSAARGRFSDAFKFIDQAKDPDLARMYKAYLTLLPHYPAPDDIKTLDLESPFSPQDNQTQNLFFSIHNSVQLPIYNYLKALALLHKGDWASAASLKTDLLTTPGDSPEDALARDLGRGIEAQTALFQGQTNQALNTLNQIDLSTWYGRIAASPFYSRSRERYLKAILLKQQEKLDEAMAQFNSFAQYSVYDLVYLGPSLLERARIAEAMQQTDAAINHYGRFIELWSDCDASVAHLLEEAKAAVKRLKPGAKG